MILKMEKLSAFGLLSDKEAVINALMRDGCVQIQSPETFDGYDEIKELTGTCTSDVYTMEQKLSRYTAALSGISLYTKKAGMFAWKPRVGYDQLQNADMQAKADSLCGEIEGLVAQISELRGVKNKDQFLKASLEPWADSDLPLEQAGTRYTVFIRCLLPTKTEAAELEAKLSETVQEYYQCTVSADREQKYLLLICHREKEEALWDVLKEYGAAKATFPGLSGTAADNLGACAARMEQAEQQISRCEERLKELGEDVSPLQYAYDMLSVQIQRQRVDAELLSTEKTFCFTAWVPESTREKTVQILEQYGCCYELREPTGEEEPPILLQNNKVATPYESVTQMYSLPAYRGFDPNNFVAVFYFIFFGMMLSDAGFGLVLFLGGLLMKKKMDLGPSAKKLVSVITWGGFSAIIWGTIFGSWFGDLFEVIPRYFFGKEVSMFQLIDPLSQATLVMGISMAFGLIHILVGMGIKGYILIKRGHPWQALFDVGLWMIVMLGLAAMLCAALFFGSDSMVFTIGAWMAIIGAAGLVLTQGRDKKNPVMKLLGGVMSLYDITGYFSDVLSYSRILALGLATGVIAQVVNIMGTLSDNVFIGIFVFPLVFLVGSALNLGINTLGAYVHTARLQYVEFFGKFYEAGGRPFSPLIPQTKYIVVTNKEEM